MPDKGVIEQLEEMQNPPKRGRGRPKGVKDSKPRQTLVDPKTGVLVEMNSNSAVVIGRIGDEKVSQFVAYHMQMMQMRQGVDKRNVPDLYDRFYRYLAYCAEHGIVPNNCNAYFAIGVNRTDISRWKLGQQGTSEQRKFAEDITEFFASVHEQAPTEGLMNPISALFWQKAHDGMVEASKLEVVNTDPLGEKKSAEEIAAKYEDVALPD